MGSSRGQTPFDVTPDNRQWWKKPTSMAEVIALLYIALHAELVKTRNIAPLLLSCALLRLFSFFFS